MVEIGDTLQVRQGDLEARLVAPVDPGGRPRMIGPVAMIAHLPPATLEPFALPVDADVRPHPHVGLAAVTYLLDGHVTHRDSLGSLCEIGPGDVACTVAGRGIVHSERFDRLRLHGGTLHLFQILLALPDEAEDTDPAFLFVPSVEVPEERMGGATIRRLVGPGSALEAGLPTPVFLHDVTLEAGARYELPPDASELGVYVLSGQIDAGAPVAAHERAVLSAPAVVTASSAARVLAFGGARMGPRYSWWNYIHSSLDAIEAAKAAWRAGEVSLPPGDTESFTLAPPDEGRPLRVLNEPG